MKARTALIVVVATALAMATAGTAHAKTTPGFSFKSKGTAINFAATSDANDPTTYEDHPFTIEKGERNGTINVHIDWLSPADDWDLYVYRKGAGGKLQTVGQSASAPPGNEENAVADSQGIPMKPGQYVIRVVNYTAGPPYQYRGTARFGPFFPYNAIPVAKLTAPRTARKGQLVKLDASGSYDPDGKIRNYSFDLDGNGSMEVDNGTNPILKRALSPGVHHVAVRVTDKRGLRAFANRTVTVS